MSCRPSLLSITPEAGICAPGRDLQSCPPATQPGRRRSVRGARPTRLARASSPPTVNGHRPIGDHHEGADRLDVGPPGRQAEQHPVPVVQIDPVLTPVTARETGPSRLFWLPASQANPPIRPLSWWSGAGWNRRPSAFQVDFRGVWRSLQGAEYAIYLRKLWLEKSGRSLQDAGQRLPSLAPGASYAAARVPAAGPH